MASNIDADWLHVKHEQETHLARTGNRGQIALEHNAGEISRRNFSRHETQSLRVRFRFVDRVEGEAALENN